MSAAGRAIRCARREYGMNHVAIPSRFVVALAIALAIALVLTHQGHAAAGFKIGGG